VIVFAGHRWSDAHGAPMRAGRGRACGGVVTGTCLGAPAHGPAAGLRVSVKQVEDIVPGRANAP
jgi:hypothetical protein